PGPANRPHLRQGEPGAGGMTAPMAFTVTGTLDGRTVSATWDDGRLTGDQAFTAAVRRLVDRKEQVVVACPWWATATLDDPIGAYATVVAALDRFEAATGAVPELPDDTPPGAVNWRVRGEGPP